MPVSIKTMLSRRSVALTAAACLALIAVAACPPPLSASPTAARVAVLVHGYLGFNVLGSGSTCTPKATLFAPGTTNEWGKVAEALRGAGWRVYFAHWRTGPAGSSTIDEAGTCLANQIAQVKLDEGVSRITLIGHSMGGLVARSYFENLETTNDVERLITFGTPHLGVNFEQFLKLASLLKLLDTSFDRTAHELSFEGVKEFNAAHVRSPRTAYYLVGGTHEGWSSFIVNPDGRLPNDGLMYTATALGLRDAGVGRFVVDDVHADILRKPLDFAREYVFSENSLACLRSFLALAGKRGCQAAPSGAMLAGAQALDDPSTAFGPTLAADLAAGETRTMPVVLGRNATVAVTLRGEATAWLRSPDGQVIRPTISSLDEGSNPPDSEARDASAVTALATFDLPDQPGDWQLHVQSSRLGPSRFAAVGTFTAPARLDLDFPAEIHGGELLSLTAHLSEHRVPSAGGTGPLLPLSSWMERRGVGRQQKDHIGGLAGNIHNAPDKAESIDSATLTAEIITPGSRRSVRLAALGDGAYAGVLTAPSELASLRVVASGHTADGLPFEQERLERLNVVDAVLAPFLPRAYLPLVSSGD